MRISSILNVCIHPQLGKVIEGSSQEWPEKGRRQYHFLSRQEFWVSTTFSVSTLFSSVALNHQARIFSTYQYHFLSVPLLSQCHIFISSTSSRGWIANEIFRRVHPDGATIGLILLLPLLSSTSRWVFASKGFRAARCSSFRWRSPGWVGGLRSCRRDRHRVPLWQQPPS